MKWISWQVFSAAAGIAVANIFLFYFAFRPGKAFVLRCVLIPIGTLFADFLAYLLFLQETFETSGDRWYVIAFWTAVVCAGIMTFFSCYLSKRTEYGTQILGRILGFKNFLETVEKDRLEAMVQDDPEYFYEILPVYICTGYFRQVDQEVWFPLPLRHRTGIQDTIIQYLIITCSVTLCILPWSLPAQPWLHSQVPAVAAAFPAAVPAVAVAVPGRSYEKKLDTNT